MKKRMNSFNRLPIYRQFLVISGISMAMVVILSSLLIFSTQRIFITNATNYAHISTERFSNELDVLCLQLDVISSRIQTESIYQELLSARSYRDLDAETIRNIEENIANIKMLYDGISDVAFCNDLIHQSTLFSAEDLSLMYQTQASEGTASGRGLGLMKSSFLPLADNTYYVYRSNIYKNGKSIGCVFLSIDINEIHLNFIEPDAPTSYFVMDPGGNIYPMSISAQISQEMVMEACQEYLRTVPSLGSELFPPNSQAQRSRFFIQMSYSPSTGCYIISAVYIPAVADSLNNIWLNIGIILAAIVLFTVTLILILFRNMIQPLNQFNGIIDGIRSSGQRHLKKPLSIEGCAEVQNLASTFSNMFSTIDKLNEQIFEASSKLYEEKIRNQATEISYFQSQINPHFLYNVLELIRSLALSKNVPEIASIAIAMGKMYRYNTKGSPIVPFREELEMTKAYVEIQKYRFQSKFDIFYNIPDDALDIPVIKIILQPLVENSIQHGIEPSLAPCMLYIGCTVTESMLLIEIRDDGVGMPPEKLREIQSLLNEDRYDTTNYVGIANTNARLKLQYGSPYGISIESHVDDGTTVTVCMPLPGKRAENQKG